MLVRDILATKGTDVATIAPTATVTELVGALADHGVGALVVTTDGTSIAGIVSERDVTRGLHSRGAALLDTPVSELMTAHVRTCRPDDPIRDVARIMTEGRFRHLPVVVDAGTLAGIVSLGDVVKKRIDELETETDQLVGYVSTAH
jgi:CBS domain-containing protein